MNARNRFFAHDNVVLGIDIGSVAVTLVTLDARESIAHESYALHHGDVRGTLRDLASTLDFARVRAVGTTTPAARLVAPCAAFDSTVAGIRAARHLHGNVDALLLVGGEKFCLVRFGPDGAYLESRGSSSCAAGTGSFLDQQARRLGLDGGAAISRTALAANGAAPKIASRCSVFAKTDLIHAQQQGYSLEAICNGLCRGLAANVVDTLFGGQPPPVGRIVLAGGVSRNEAVRRHLEQLIDRPLVVDDHSHVYGALGAALLVLDAWKDGPPAHGAPASVDDLLRAPARDKLYAHPPLELVTSRHPEFLACDQDSYTPRQVKGAAPVEIDRGPALAAAGPRRVLLGLDIGSTSTKAILLDVDSDGPAEDRVVAGFYTRTAGQPIIAMQGLLEAIDATATARGIELLPVGVATTGSGRKLVGTIIGADEIVDEITAHARAAYELDPEVDTILEIGGQDAKFTTLDRGRVTLAVMNNVCAAGTGSFIEEQAIRLGCELASCAARTQGRRAPLTSDCCTVFMERDINHFLASGYEVDEVLAAALHAVCENYLRKVARESAIGKKVCFQGATAKNRSLVAAFEQRLQRPIFVSRYCHLTGALGAALLLAEHRPASSAFRGLDLFRATIPVGDETCTLCGNHCKLKVASVRGQRVAYGMLCGRDDDQERYVPSNKSGFDLLRVLRKHWAQPQPQPRWPVTIGLPPALALYEDLPMWQHFFSTLGIRTVTNEADKDVVSLGKRVEGAEFCAPMAAYHGHVVRLASIADYVFSPFYLEDDERAPGTRRNFCYYSQFAGSLAATIPDAAIRSKLLTPVLKNGESQMTRASRLFETLRPVLGHTLRKREVVRAYLRAARYAAERKAALPALMAQARASDPEQLSVVLLGRPYTALSPAMSKSIPDLFAAQGVKCFAQSMLTPTDADRAAIQPLLRTIHWAYPAQMLAAAQAVASSPGLYPVIITSFKCAPDSCSLESVRRILDRRGKPYLILQLDDHDSQVGYETRIEAALRSFRNHDTRTARRTPPKRQHPASPDYLQGMHGSTVLIPAWDRYACSMMAANFRREGIDARVLDEDPLLFTRALQHNSGQCLPLNVIVEAFIDYVTRHHIAPAQAAIWIHSSQMGCNIGAFPLVMQGLLETHGNGFERSRVYIGQMTGKDISVRAIANQYRVFLCAGYLRRIGCRVRPYEVHRGHTDALLEESRLRLCDAFEHGRQLLPEVHDIVDRFLAIETRPARRPKVAIFGDMYVRDNDAFNQGVIARIEQEGGEVVTTPYTDYTKLIADSYLRKWVREGKVKQALEGKLVLVGARILERELLREFARVLGPAPKVPDYNVADVLSPYRVTVQHTGESFDNLLKIHHLTAAHPDLALLVQLSPAFCCPSLVTEAMTREVRTKTGVPVVTITYDGTRAPKNDVIAPYLHHLRTRSPR